VAAGNDPGVNRKP